MTKSMVKTVAGSLGYLVLVASCLMQWHTARWWARFDWFAGSYLALRLLGSIHSVVSSLPVFRSRVLRQEWWALNSDPAGPRWVMLLMALDLTVFLDYSHWRLTPSLMQPALQLAGIAAYSGVTLWQIWTDQYLSGFFERTQQPQTPMNRGPYRYVRHPRYAAAIVGKVGMALIFGSIFGWVLVAAWGFLLLNKINIEEKHLRQMFGGHYESYARNTAKVIPGIY